MARENTRHSHTRHAALQLHYPGLWVIMVLLLRSAPRTASEKLNYLNGPLLILFIITGVILYILLVGYPPFWVSVLPYFLRLGLAVKF